jgi:hypothetical protein
MAGFEWNYTTWLNIPALLLAGWFVFLHRASGDKSGSGMPASTALKTT